jgi:5-methylcytosine-specific restriction endonuclease McrA
MVLARDPLCKIEQLCGSGPRRDGEPERLPAPSTDADHVVPRSAGGEDTMENLQGACHACHSWKTATQDSNFARRAKPKQAKGVGGSKSSRSPAA